MAAKRTPAQKRRRASASSASQTLNGGSGEKEKKLELEEEVDLMPVLENEVKVKDKDNHKKGKMQVEGKEYIKEEDIPLEYDEDYRLCIMPPLPPRGEGETCTLVSCLLGCVCESLRSLPVARLHCGRTKCFFGCDCSIPSNKDVDDRDIRKRLRPRVSLLNWRFMESDIGKESGPINYRQLERGPAILPRLRRMPVTPVRFRNEALSSTKGSKDKIKKPGQGTRSRRQSGKKPVTPVKQVGKKTEGNKTKHKSPSRSADKDKYKGMPVLVKMDEFQPHVAQLPLRPPRLVEMMGQDALVLKIGSSKYCNLIFSLETPIPKAIIFEGETDNGIEPVPWLYLPMTPDKHVWLSHEIDELNTIKTDAVFIPEINCMIPSGALKVQMKRVEQQQKCVSLKMLWIGVDTKERRGSIYFLPELPGLMISGPFPHNQLETRYNSVQTRVDQIYSACCHTDEMEENASLGSNRIFDIYKQRHREKVLEELQQRVKDDEDSHCISAQIPAQAFKDYGVLPSDSDSSVSSFPEDSDDDHLVVDWSDVAELLSVSDCNE